MTDIRKTIKRLEELEAKASSGPWFDGYVLYPENITLADAALIVTMRNALPELLQKLQELLPANNEKLVTEWCSECGAEVSMYWDIKDAGYKAYCPHCGWPLMLCSECIDEHGACGTNSDGKLACDERDYARDKSYYSGGE